MTTSKSKKVNKYRAHTTHGGGSRKKRRGAGSRGGRGNAGTGKRAGHKKAGRLTIFGKKGFLPRRNTFLIKAVNLNYFTSNKINQLVSQGKVAEQSGYYTVDLSKLGFNKLLGAGNISLKLKITAQEVSAKAAKKVEQAGGEIISSEATEQVTKSAETNEENKE
jgi:large subunit ribosomal protein L15